MNARLAGLGALLLATALFPAATAAADETKAAAAVPNFSGRWRLNKELSDKPQVLPTPEPKKDAAKKGDAKDAKPDAAKSDAAKPEAKPDTANSGPADAAKADAAKPDASKPDAKPADAGKDSQPPAEAAAEFTVRQTDLEVAAQDNIGQTRSFYPNGKTYKADEGASTVKTEWKDGALVFEKKNSRGWRYTESWKLLPDGRLRLDTRIEGGGQKAASTKRIYDRVMDEKK